MTTTTFRDEGEQGEAGRVSSPLVPGYGAASLGRSGEAERRRGKVAAMVNGVGVGASLGRRSRTTCDGEVV